MFSVVIPLHNKSRFIEKALRSALDQTFRDFEIIVVNDGSTDDGPEKVKELIQNTKPETRNQEPETRNLKPETYFPRITLIDQMNAGVSTARNNGVKAARFDYIAFLDADDWWDKHFLEEMKGLIEQCPDAGMWGSNYYYVKNGKNRLEDKGLPLDFTSGYIDYFKLYASTFCVPINCSFVIIRKEIFIQEGGFNPALKFGEDLDLWIRIALKHKVAYLNRPLAYSNQDIPSSYRALGDNKRFKKEEHVIFNMKYLEGIEIQEPDIKKLLDGLRVRSLVDYYLHDIYISEVDDLLEKIDFTKQTLYYKLIYSCPKIIVRLFFKFRRSGALYKRHIVNKLSFE